MKLPYATEKTAEIMGVRRNSHWKEFWKLRIGTELWHKPFTPIPAYLCSVCSERIMMMVVMIMQADDDYNEDYNGDYDNKDDDEYDMSQQTFLLPLTIG